MGLFAKFKEAWLKPMSFDSLNEGFYDDLEEALILADVGMDTAVDAVAQLKKRAYAKLLTHEEDVKNALRDILAEKLSVGDPALDLSTRPSVALIIGVNGVGKTTSIGKLAHRLKNEGKKVLLCAGDTFRAAAADQLEIWAERAGVDIVRQNEGADPGVGRHHRPERSHSGPAVQGDGGSDGHHPHQAGRYRQGWHRHCHRTGIAGAGEVRGPWRGHR